MHKSDISSVKSSHVIAPLLILTLVLLGVQSSTRGPSNPQIRADPEEEAQLRELRRKGNVLFRDGQYLRAVGLYEKGYQKARHAGNLRSAVRFLNNLGGAYYRTFRYRDALHAYLEARDLATVQGDHETLGALCVNLSSLYFELGDIDAALESAERGLKLPSHATARYTARLLIQSARVKGQKNAAPQAIAMLRDAIEASRSELDISSESQAWNELGNTLVECGRLQDAESALLEAFRLRKLTHDDRINFSYESLGNLRVLQGDLKSAVLLLDKAVDSARLVSPSAVWSAYYDRGKAKLSEGRLHEAFADFGAALKCARRWRGEVLPADVFRISSEGELHQLYSAYIEVGSRLYEETRQKRFVQQTFAAAEESRAASLRALWAGPDLTKKLPNEYWEALADLYRAEAALIKNRSDADTLATRRLRLKVAEMEALAGLDFPRDLNTSDAVDGGLLERAQRTLRPREVFLGFHLGDSESCLWVIGRRGFEFRRLPPRRHFAERVSTLVKAVRENSPEATKLGNRVYAQLFGPTSRALLDKPTWIVAPDGPLFEVPFAALVEGFKSHSNTPLYVVERHAVRVVPGISVLFRTATSDSNGPVVGVGDPIYNRADPRLPHTPRRSEGQSSAQLPKEPLELARLVGSAREIENCASIWRSQGHEPILLTGAAANKENLLTALRRNPEVLHVAAHLLFPPQPSGPGLVALALQPGSEIELLSATEISNMRIKLGLVVLNGCSSARAATLPGAGLMGMTRSWLAAGARAVIVTRWATDDQDAGELFRSFYEHLSSPGGSGRRRSFAQLLQQAQLTQLRAGGRRSNPAYWAAYFCVERN
jgi:CHAT domain-containing protein